MTSALRRPSGRKVGKMRSHRGERARKLWEDHAGAWLLSPASFSGSAVSSACFTCLHLNQGGKLERLSEVLEPIPTGWLSFCFLLAHVQILISTWLTWRPWGTFLAGGGAVLLLLLWRFGSRSDTVHPRPVTDPVLKEFLVGVGMCRRVLTHLVGLHSTQRCWSRDEDLTSVILPPLPGI